MLDSHEPTIRVADHNVLCVDLVAPDSTTEVAAILTCNRAYIRLHRENGYMARSNTLTFSVEDWALLVQTVGRLLSRAGVLTLD